MRQYASASHSMSKNEAIIMEKQTILNCLTYQEKIDALMYYYKSNNCIPYMYSQLAKDIAEIYKWAVKENFLLAIDVCDQILISCCKINRSRVVAPSPEEKHRDKRILGKLAPKIISFAPTLNDINKLKALNRYIIQDIEK